MREPLKLLLLAKGTSKKGNKKKKNLKALDVEDGSCQTERSASDSAADTDMTTQSPNFRTFFCLTEKEAYQQIKRR